MLPLFAILDGLPRNFRPATLVALHSGEASTLPTLFQMRCRLPVKFTEGGEVVREGNVYVAPAQAHLIVNPNRHMSGIHKQRLQFARPSADWLFDTIAATYSDAASVSTIVVGDRTRILIQNSAPCISRRTRRRRWPPFSVR